MKKILILHTGGTLGMKEEDGKTTFVPSDFTHNIRQHVPQLEEMAEIEVSVVFNLDSSDLGISHWKTLADRVAANLDDYDGFVIVHGTDTMVYTACALSFMLHNVPKPVIMTGSQRPLSKIRNDARNNLINAVELATMEITEVALLFNNRLYRGNRSKKISIDDFDAFSSPNLRPLAEIGLNVELDIGLLVRPAGPLDLQTNFDNRVMCLRLFPGTRSELYDALLKTDVRAIVLEAFGSGNVPIDKKHLLEFIDASVGQGKIFAVGSQCMNGTVDLNRYAGGKKAADAGAWSCQDMTTEASVVKLMYLLGKYGDDTKRIHADFHRSLAGELS